MLFNEEGFNEKRHNAQEHNEDLLLLEALEKRDIDAFIRLDNLYGDDLKIYAYMQLYDRELLARTFQQLSRFLWEEARFNLIRPPIYSFLCRQIDRICNEQIDME